MAFEDVMRAVGGWSVAIQAAAAVGAELELKQSGTAAPPAIAAALHAVSEAAGVGDLDELPPPQRAVAASLIRLALREASELLDNPAREPGWTSTDPVVLDGWGRGSTMVPMLLASAVPGLGEVNDFLDVGTGVGLLAVAAAGLWPTATIVGIDRWEPSLARARAHVEQAGLGDRIELRDQDIVAVDDVDRFDLVWVPTFFMTDDVLAEAAPRLVRATRPGGRIALGIFRVPPDPVAAATNALGTIRSGGINLDPARGMQLLEQAGCTAVSVVSPPGPAPLELIVGHKPG